MDKKYIYWNSPRKLETHDEKKGWGFEKHIWNSKNTTEIKELGYCLKLLVFEKPVESSMHFHALKHEVFHIISGVFKLFYIDPRDATELEMDLVAGESVVIPPNNPHRIVCYEPGTIVEASTPDHREDSYRVSKGASQR